MLHVNANNKINHLLSNYSKNNLLLWIVKV